MERPRHLPDYDSPPLEEVVVGVQFEKFSGMTSLHASRIHDLFKGDFPGYEEHPPLEPRFETFGGDSSERRVSVQFGPPISRPRQWFISESGSHLLQVQDDRFLLNWRKQSDGDYPHFEGVHEVFRKNFGLLSEFGERNLGQSINLTQAEVTYVNFIDVGEYSEASNWVLLCSSEIGDVEGFRQEMSSVLSDDRGNRYARFHRKIATVVYGDDRQNALQFELSVKGKPHNGDWSTVDPFLLEARDRIVSEFDRVTTQKAHERWGKL